MVAIDRIPVSRKSPQLLPALTLAAGAGGMAISFLFLASADPLDVMAGAAGFVGGSILASAAVVSIALLRQPGVDGDPDTITVDDGPAVLEPFAVDRWLEHFQRNSENRVEPRWDAPLTLPDEVVRPLVQSLAQFQLGDGGGPAYLIARDRERLLSVSPGMRSLVDRWFAEEREHARLLGHAVSRFGGQRIQGHWSFTVFCLTRTWFGVGFELTVLLLTEIVSTVYYRLLCVHGDDPALRSMCRLILRDEHGHVAFHRDRLAQVGRIGQASYGRWWACRFRVLGLAAATMLWLNHARGLQAVGVTRGEFYREIWRGLSRFIQRLRWEAAPECLGK